MAIPGFLSRLLSHSKLRLPCRWLYNPGDLLPFADPESVARLQAKQDENGTLMQSDLNEESLYTLFNQRRKQTRARTTTDFIQNTVNEGEWEYDDSYQANELPDVKVSLHCLMVQVHL